MSLVGSKARLDSLTGLRAIAAFLVFLHHWAPKNKNVLSDIVLRICAEFHVGVTVFFVLSGFLITYNYADSLEFNASGLWRYTVNRFARIYPVYLLLFISQEVYVYGFSRSVVLWLANLTLTKGFFDQGHFYGISQAWSLTVEECFYFSVPILFLIYRRFVNKASRAPSSATIVLSAVAFAELAILVGLFLSCIPLSFDGRQFMGSKSFIFGYTFFGRAFEFYVGVVLAYLWRNQWKAHFVIGRYSILTLIGGGSFFLIVYALSFFSTPTSWSLSTVPGYLLNTVLLPIAICVFILGLISEQSAVRRFLEAPLMLVLGKASYVFYLLHQGPFSDAIDLYFNSSQWSWFAALVGLSVVIYMFFEHPMNWAIRTLLTKQKSR